MRAHLQVGVLAVAGLLPSFVSCGFVNRGREKRDLGPGLRERVTTENIWAELDETETTSIVNWLSGRQELNLTSAAEANDWSNTIRLVELQQPNKSSVLTYLDDAGSKPVKYAHVTLDVRATEEPYLQDIIVGPLPISNDSTTWSPLEYPSTKRDQGKVRNLQADLTALTAWQGEIAKSIDDILRDLFSTDAPDTDLQIWTVDPLYQTNGRVVQWAQFWRSPSNLYDTRFLMPLGLYFKGDITGRDPSQWKFKGWLYNDIFYETTDAFKTAYAASGFAKLEAVTDGPWGWTGQQGEPFSRDSISPPKSVATGEPRYAVDMPRKFVEWMGWSFYIVFTRDTGMSLRDIRYKGQRIMYELGMQEALVHYSGHDPIQSSTAYLDSFNGFGFYTFGLIDGYDCPEYSTYFNTTYYEADEMKTQPNTLCLFEYDADYPMRRHKGILSSDYKAASKNVQLKLRAAATLGNYDYMFTYTLSFDGTIDVEVRASGYIQAAFYAGNTDYGWQIHDGVSGSLHDHVIHFKADLDILGSKNSFWKIDQVPTTKTYSWSDGQARNTMALERSFIETENDSRINWGIDSRTQFAIVNKDATNKFGNPRGYRVFPSSKTAHLTVEDSPNLINAAKWASNDLQVTVQHDTEPRSAHPYNNQDLNNPPIDFDKFFNGESLDQEDLVLWFNLGMHHVPHTGDLPNTVLTTAHSSVTFAPLNYFDGDPSSVTVQQFFESFGESNETVPAGDR